MAGSPKPDVIYGGDGEDMLNGLSGDDNLFGEAGEDMILGSFGNDHLDGGDGNDALYAEDGADSLAGGSGDDILDGGSGDDVLQGFYGADELTGGDGNDIFLYTTFLGSTGIAPPAGFPETLGIDTITDFIPGMDKIDLSGIDANILASTSATNETFEFIGTDAFSGSVGELRYGYDENSLIIQSDQNGDSLPELEIHLTRSPWLDGGIQESDFIL